jgi:hypothetical protein
LIRRRDDYGVVEAATGFGVKSPGPGEARTSSACEIFHFHFLLYHTKLSLSIPQKSGCVSLLGQDLIGSILSDLSAAKIVSKDAGQARNLG